MSHFFVSIEKGNMRIYDDWVKNLERVKVVTKLYIPLKGHAHKLTTTFTMILFFSNRNILSYF